MGVCFLYFVRPADMFSNGPSLTPVFMFKILNIKLFSTEISVFNSLVADQPIPPFQALIGYSC